MCGTCGCAEAVGIGTVAAPGAVVHARQHRSMITLEAAVLAKSARHADRNRRWLAERGIVALNLMSAPGAGKTRLLERTLTELKDELAMGVIEGDQETAFDAERIRATGCAAVQINTGTGCHIDAAILGRALRELDPPRNSMVMIENVGNLVCPALFDLGERARVVILSVTEGEDKPLKYPHMFRRCDLLLINKADLLPHVAFDVEQCVEYARRLNPGMDVLTVSAATGHNMARWYGWLRAQAESVRR